jgi:RNA polymerase sigma factor (sigma-70 family)
MSTSQPEPDLVAVTLSAQRGEPAAREDLLARLAPMLEGAARRADALARHIGADPAIDLDDYRQEARVAALTHLRAFRPALGHPLPFFVIRVRASLRKLVHARARRQPPGGRLTWSPAVQHLLEELTAERYLEEESRALGSLADALHDALTQLGARQKRALFWCYVRHLSDESIAAILDVSPLAAYRLRHRALNRLRRTLALGGSGAPDRPAGSYPAAGMTAGAP